MNQELLQKVLSSPRLPSLPTIALEVIDLVQQEDVNIKQIAKTIQHDPALSSKILKTVNSSFYGQAHSISTISHALVVLGLNSVKTLALGFSLVGNLKDAAHGLDHFAYWKRSLYTAAASRTFARASNIVQQEEAFLGGLLQDLGMLAMASVLGREYQSVLSASGEHRDLSSLERETFQMDHPEVGAALAKQWKLPEALIAPIQFHEAPDNAPNELRPLARCVGLGNLVADLFTTESSGPALREYFQQADRWFNLSKDRAEPLLADIHKTTVEMKQLFELPTGQLEGVDEILARANEALLQINLVAAQERAQLEQQTSELQETASRLEQQNRELAARATTDSLTGVANRGYFNEAAVQLFRTCTEERKPLSIMFLDTDHFKKFNDTYGHQTGDRVLVEKARTLRECTPESAMVARYGGEEFAVLLPGMERAEAARLAEQTRQAIQSMAVESDEGKPLRVTASIGVATHDGNFFTRVEMLIKAADQAVYAAKDAGRNCVRVFAPRPRKVA